MRRSSLPERGQNGSGAASDGTGGITSGYFIAQLHEARADLPYRYQAQRRTCDTSWEQRLTPPQSD